MEILLDSMIMVLLGLFGTYILTPQEIPVVELFIVLIFSSLNFIFVAQKGESKKEQVYYCIKKSFIVMTLIISVFLPYLSLLVPVLVLQNPWTKKEVLLLCAGILVFGKDPIQLVFLVILTVLALSLSHRYYRYQVLRDNFHKSKGEADYLYRNLRVENQRLVENQNIEIVNSTLKERNRISKEIHDNVGHLLSSALLQIGALEFLISEDLKEPFKKLRETMEEAMDKTRKSVHGLYDKSLNMEIVLKELQESYHFCPLYYSIDIEKEPEAEIHYAMVSILKEALSNAAKHSDADRVDIQLTEVQDMYHLLIKDNGNFKSKEGEKGLGLMSMRERVEDLNGNFYLNKEKGYRIFITIPTKEN